jgi:hypothetical protein
MAGLSRALRVGGQPALESPKRPPKAQVRNACHFIGRHDATIDAVAARSARGGASARQAAIRIRRGPSAVPIRALTGRVRPAVVDIRQPVRAFDVEPSSRSTVRLSQSGS